jgi:predicted RecA/RadA family phage recombinase
MHCQSNTKLLGIDNASWRFGSWNGSTLSSVSTITFDSTYSSNLRVYKPDTTTDKWYAAFINTSNQLVIGSYSISGSTITRDYLKVVINSGAGVTIGDIIGSGSTGLVLGYENDSKGYVATFSADSSTREITGVGSVVTHNLSNEAPIPWGVNSTNKFATAYSSSSNLINTRVLTVNAYATSALNWLGVAQTSGTAGQSVNIVMDGIAAGFSGLTTGEKYYYDTSTFDASVTTTVTDYLIGTATSATEIKLNA